MKDRHRRRHSLPFLVSIASVFMLLAFLQIETDMTGASHPATYHANRGAISERKISLLADSVTTGITTTTITSVSTTTSTSTSVTTTTSTVLTTTKSTTTTTSTAYLQTTTTRTTTTAYFFTRFSPTVTAPLTIAIISTGKTTTTTTTTSTETEIFQTALTTLIRTTVTTTATSIARPCIIASVAYGSPIAPEVQFLREFRDGTAMRSFAGIQFMRAFNGFYYSFSPSLARVVMEVPLVQALIRAFIYPLLTSLRLSIVVPMLAPEMSEFTTVPAGIVASSLIGVVYASPLAVMWKLVPKKRPKLRRVLMKETYQ